MRDPRRARPRGLWIVLVWEPLHVGRSTRVRGVGRFDEIERRTDELPPVETRIAVYSKSGRMSAIAARTLARLGYRHIVELRGGMDAWRETGRPLAAT